MILALWVILGCDVSYNKLDDFFFFFIYMLVLQKRWDIIIIYTYACTISFADVKEYVGKMST